MVRRCSWFLCNPEPELAREREPYDLRKLSGEIPPLRVTLCKQCDLLLSSPLLDLLLTIGSYRRVAESLKVHQPIYLVFPGETIKGTSFVLGDPFPEIVSKTHIQRAA